MKTAISEYLDGHKIELLLLYCLVFFSISLAGVSIAALFVGAYLVSLSGIIAIVVFMVSMSKIASIKKTLTADRRIQQRFKTEVVS